MIKLTNIGKAVGATLTTAFEVTLDGAKLGTAYRNESGPRRGNYTYGSFHGSRARLIAMLERDA